MALGLAVRGAALAYLICYLRTLRKIAEQPDILTTHGGFHWLPSFGDALRTAIVQFSIRTLLRSRQHRVILSFYIGLAVGLAIFFANPPALRTQLSGSDPWHQVNAPMLMASFIMMGAAVLGARVLFSPAAGSKGELGSSASRRFAEERIAWWPAGGPSTCLR